MGLLPCQVITLHALCLSLTSSYLKLILLLFSLIFLLLFTGLSHSPFHFLHLCGLVKPKRGQRFTGLSLALCSLPNDKSLEFIANNLFICKTLQTLAVMSWDQLMLSGTPYLKIPRIIKNVTVAKKCDLESCRTP